MFRPVMYGGQTRGDIAAKDRGCLAHGQGMLLAESKVKCVKWGLFSGGVWLHRLASSSNAAHDLLRYVN